MYYEMDLHKNKNMQTLAYNISYRLYIFLRGINT